eukprot:Nk52_evm16s539 gene=Nk52_evmTU16s539
MEQIKESQEYQSLMSTLPEDVKRLRLLSMAVDPENTPYDSKYQARAILKELIGKIEGLMRQCSGVLTGRSGVDDSHSSRESGSGACRGEQAASSSSQLLGSSLKLKLSTLRLWLAENFIQTDELSSGKEVLLGLEEEMGADDFVASPRNVLLTISVLNQLGILCWSLYSSGMMHLNPDTPMDEDHQHQKKTLEYFQEALEVYKTFSRAEFEACPMSLEEIMNDADGSGSTWDYFEAEHTQTLFYLAQIYGKMGNSSLSAAYCKKTLSRQYGTEAFDAESWCLNCAGLSTFYLQQGRYRNALHCLQVVDYVMGESRRAEERKKTYTSEDNGDDDQDQENASKREREKQFDADMDLYWGKFALGLLCESSDRYAYFKRTGEKPRIANENGEEVEEVDGEEEVVDPIIDLQTEGELEEFVYSEKFASDFDGARLLFKLGNSHLQRAMEFYQLDGYVTAHIEILQNISLLYKNLIPFEEDIGRKSKMMKRRIDLLEPILGELSMQHYLNYCRQLMYELGETYHDLLDLKREQFETGPQGGDCSKALAKINTCVSKSAAYFCQFVDSYKVPETGKLPHTYEGGEEVVLTVMNAHLYLARIYTKTIGILPEVESQFLEKSYLAYKYIIDFCGRSDVVVPEFQEQLALCKEMSELVLMKKQKIDSQLRL